MPTIKQARTSSADHKSAAIHRRPEYNKHFLSFQTVIAIPLFDRAELANMVALDVLVSVPVRFRLSLPLSEQHVQAQEIYANVGFQAAIHPNLDTVDTVREPMVLFSDFPI